MFQLNMARRTAKPWFRLYDDAVEHYLVRHPAYKARLPHMPLALDDIWLLALHLAAGGADREQLLAAWDEEPRMSAALESLSAAELLLPAPVSAAAHYLQRIHGNQNAHESDVVRTLCFSAVAEVEAPLISLGDGTELSGMEIAEFARRLRMHLANLGIAAGEWMVVCPDAEPLLWIAALAAADAGINVRIAGQVAESYPASLRLCPDGERMAEGWIALGLDGNPDGLLSILEASSNRDVVRCTGQGLIEITTAHGRMRCPLGLVAAGCVALRSHRVRQVLLLGSGSELMDFLTMLTALLDRQRLLSA